MGFDWLRRHEGDIGPSPAEIIDRVEAERRAAQHEAPARPFTVDQAHREMQLHRECRLADCPRKSAARDVLVSARRMVPAGWESKVSR